VGRLLNTYTSLKRCKVILLIACWIISAQSGFCAVQKNIFSVYGEKLGIPVYEWKDDSVSPKALIVAIHGLTFYGSAFDGTATQLASQGYTVYAYDLRGFGRWHQEKDKFPSDEKPHYDQGVEDGRKLISLLHEQNPDLKIFCLGESLGANMSLLLAAQQPQIISGIMLSGLAVKQAWYPRARWVKDGFNTIVFPNRPFNLAPYSKLYLASNPTVTQIYLNDPKIFRQLTAEQLIKALVLNARAVKQADKIPPSVQILALTGAKDTVFKPKHLSWFAQKVGPDRTTIKVLPNKGHLLLELQPYDPEIIDTMDKWLSKNVQPNPSHPNNSLVGELVP
jgi:alpha-beta hydrolase superfamily lysophospholipase